MRVVITDRIDAAAVRAVRQALKDCRARVVGKNRDPLGDFEDTTFVIGEHVISVDIDHWTGITLDGPEQFVGPFAERVRNLLA